MESRQRKNARRLESDCHCFLVTTVQAYKVIYGDQHQLGAHEQTHVLAEFLQLRADSFPPGSAAPSDHPRERSLAQLPVLKNVPSTRAATSTDVFSARAISSVGRPQPSHFGSPVFAYAGKTEPPPSSQIHSQTSAGEKVATSSIALLLFSFPCSPGAVPSSRLRSDNGAAQGRSRLALVRLAQPAPALPGHALTDPSTAFLL